MQPRSSAVRRRVFSILCKMLPCQCLRTEFHWKTTVSVFVNFHLLKVSYQRPGRTLRPTLQSQSRPRHSQSTFAVFSSQHTATATWKRSEPPFSSHLQATSTVGFCGGGNPKPPQEPDQTLKPASMLRASTSPRHSRRKPGETHRPVSTTCKHPSSSRRSWRVTLAGTADRGAGARTWHATRSATCSSHLRDRVRTPWPAGAPAPQLSGPPSCRMRTTDSRHHRVLSSIKGCF